ncbi:hypothetical protein D3C85_1043640 [compost metagenome]
MQVARRQGDTAGIAIHRLADEAGDLAFLLIQARQVFIDAAHVIGRAIAATESTTVGIGRGHRVHPVRAGAQGLRVVGDRGRNGIGGHRPTVVGLQHAEHVAATAVGPGQADGQVIGFSAAVDQEHSVHGVRRQLQQAFGELGNRRIVKARVGVEQRPLPRGFDGHARVAVAEHRDVIEHVQVGPALHVDQVVAPAALDVRRGFIVVLLRAGKAGIAAFEQAGRIDDRLGITIKTQQLAWRWAQRKPGGSTRRRAE